MSAPAVDKETTRALAKRFRALHAPGSPIFLGNIYDGATLRASLGNPSCRALATASFAIAETFGVDDHDMTREQNFSRITLISSLLHSDPDGKGKTIPLSADIQDGYDSPAQTIRDLIKLGIVGCNLEDNGHGGLYSIEKGEQRVREAVQAARDEGVEDFVINARVDALMEGGSVEDALERGKRYLAAGACTIFIWGGPGRGLSREEVARFVKEWEGRVAVKMNVRDVRDGKSAMQPKDFRDAGVARVSVGPELFWGAMRDFQEGMKLTLSGNV